MSNLARKAPHLFLSLPPSCCLQIKMMCETAYLSHSPPFFLPSLVRLLCLLALLAFACELALASLLGCSLAKLRARLRIFSSSVVGGAHEGSSFLFSGKKRDATSQLHSQLDSHASFPVKILFSFDLFISVPFPLDLKKRGHKNRKRNSDKDGDEYREQC